MPANTIATINRRFKKALYDPIITLYHYNGCGYFDGGCLLLADALVLWSEGDMKLGAISRASLSGQIDHWFTILHVAGKTFLLDAHGLQNQKSFLKYWEKEEGLQNPVIIQNPQVDPAGEIPRDLAFSKTIAEQLKDSLGEYLEWKSTVTEIVESIHSASLAR